LALSQNRIVKPGAYKIKTGDVCDYTGVNLAARFGYGRCYKYNDFYIAKMYVYFMLKTEDTIQF